MPQLEKIISNLKKKSVVDAVFTTGSYGKNSDIDLVIILNTGTDIKSLFQWVDGRPCEVHIFPSDEIKQLNEKDFISPNDPEGLIINLLEKANIKFDNTGVLTSLVKDFTRILEKLRVPESKKIWFDGVINWAYVTNKRYFESNDSYYLEALEVKLTGDLNLLIKGYFEFRNIPWKGEKKVLTYLKSYDPDFYRLFLSCLRVTSLKEKFGLYTELVNRVFPEGYHVWNKDVIYPSPVQSIKGQEYWIKFWKDLIS